MFSLVCVWINNRGTGDLRRHRAHYYVSVMTLAVIRVVVNLIELQLVFTARFKQVGYVTRQPLLELICLPLQWRHNGCDGVWNHLLHHCLLNRLFRRRSKKTLKLRITGLCTWVSPVTGEFPVQKASDAENISIWWRHLALPCYQLSAAHLTIRHAHMIRGYRFPNELQGLDAKIGHQVSSPNNGHEDDIPYWLIALSRVRRCLHSLLSHYK